MLARTRRWVRTSTSFRNHLATLVNDGGTVHNANGADPGHNVERCTRLQIKISAGTPQGDFSRGWYTVHVYIERVVKQGSRPDLVGPVAVASNRSV